MSRGFMGGGGGMFGKKKKKKSAREIFEAKRRGEDDESLTPEQRYQKLVKEKTEDLRKQMSKGSKFTLPGTDPEAGQKLSKSAEALIEMMAQKQAKKEAKKQKAASAIQAKWLGSAGRIDKSGKIYGPDGKCVAKVDAKTGKIKASSGRSLGKYDPKSPMNETKIIRYIQSQQKKPAPAGTGLGNVGNFWGGGDDNKGGGFWG
ncbi:MAG: hypothetical protein U1E36_03545 [Rickettsiales bacterium]